MEERLNASTDSLPTTIGTGMVTHNVFISTFSLPITICVLGPGNTKTEMSKGILESAAIEGH